MAWHTSATTTYPLRPAPIPRPRNDIHFAKHGIFIRRTNERSTWVPVTRDADRLRRYGLELFE